MEKKITTMKADSSKISASVAKLESDNGIAELQRLQKASSAESEKLRDRINSLEQELKA